MTSMGWTEDDRQDLTTLVKRRAPRLLGAARRAGRVSISGSDREALRAVLADELSESGLDTRDEPNSRGIRLEELIDKLGHIPLGQGDSS